MEVENVSESSRNEDKFIDLGEIEVWFFDEHNQELKEGFHLLGRSFNGDNFYYISKGKVKYLVRRERGMIEGDWFNARADKYFYLNIPAWPQILDDGEVVHASSEQSSEGERSLSEQPHSPQPFQVWVPCYACNNSGQCSLCNGLGWRYSASDRYYDGKAPCINCNGSGKCTTCAGQGGHNEIQYR